MSQGIETMPSVSDGRSSWLAPAPPLVTADRTRVRHLARAMAGNPASDPAVVGARVSLLTRLLRVRTAHVVRVLYRRPWLDADG